jgi:hypothetical protein
MKFHALLPVRDEADVLAECLEHLLAWADAVYVFDTGSLDECWDIVQDFAGSDRRIVPLKRDSVYFSETKLRGWMFNEARQRMRDGDWFLRVDADEIHHISPPAFVRERLRPWETVAYHQYFDFKLLNSEVAAWTSERDMLADRSRPIEERRRWFIPSVYSEPRLCRYRDSMRWPPNVSFPFNAGFVARARLPIRHYPHRDPLQLARRCRLRAVMMEDEQNRTNWSRPDLHHWAEAEWRRFITDDHAAGLQYWQPGSDLPAIGAVNHLRRPHVRLAQRLLHASVVRAVDRLRPAWPRDEYPQLISLQIQMRLRRELGGRTDVVTATDTER